MKVESVEAYQVFDSRGKPTVEAVVRLENGVSGYGVTPAGKSTGQFEAVALVDGEATRFGGRSVFQAIHNAQSVIGPRLRGMDAFDQAGIDRAMIELDGTENKSRLGANAILAVSMAVSRAAANSLGIPLFRRFGDGNLLPLPQVQIFGGGAHADGRVDVQDFQITTVGAQSYDECLEMIHNVYCAAEAFMKRNGKLKGVADEGGFWPEFRTNEEAMDAVVETIQLAGYQPGRDVSLSLDIAASHFYDGKGYRLAAENRYYSSDEFIELIVRWCQKFPIVSIEDPLADTDVESWQTLFGRLGKKLQIIGDDLFCTSLPRIQKGIQLGLANAVLIKLNQVGTVTETLAAIHQTQQAGWLPVVSARSGETEDAFISHLAVGTNAGQLKVGSFARSERTVKWNEVIRIARQLGARSDFRGGRIYESILASAFG